MPPEFQVSSYTTYYAREPSVAPAEDGSFFVVWANEVDVGPTRGVDAPPFEQQGYNSSSVFARVVEGDGSIPEALFAAMVEFRVFPIIEP